MSAFSHIQFAAKSDVGRKRKNNEDSFGVFPESGVFCVADGMGGGDDGEIASAAVVKEVATFAQSHVPLSNAGFFGKELAAELISSLNDASGWIFKRAKDRNLKGCGSTFVGVCFDATAPASAIALHVGDSRLYRIRGTSIRQITRDHSAAELIGAKDENTINPCFRGVILRAVGVRPSVDVEQTDLPLREGDRIVICSDGLSRMVDDRKMLTIVHACETPGEAVEALVAAANAAGGTDNITAIVLFVGSLPPACPGLSIPQRSARERSRSRSADSCDNDTSDTDTDCEFSSEADTADDTQTIGTMTTQVSQVGTVRMSMPQQKFQTLVSTGSRMPMKRTWGWVIATILSVAVTAALTSLVWLCVVGGRGKGEPGRVAESQKSDQPSMAQRGGEEKGVAVKGAPIREVKQPVTVQLESMVQNVEDDLVKNRIVSEQGRPNRKTPDQIQSEQIPPEQTTNAVETAIGHHVSVAEDKPVSNIVENMSADVHPSEQISTDKNWTTVVLPRLVAAYTPSNAEAFVKTVRRLPNTRATSVAEEFLRQFRLICNSSLPIKRRRAVAEAITADVLDIVRELKKYSDMRISRIDAALADHMTRVEFREKLVDERDGLVAFTKASEKFRDADPTLPDTQIAGAEIIIGIVKWFKQIK